MLDKVIICPFCNKEQSDDAMLRSDDDVFAIAPNEEDAEMDCESCGKTIYIKGSYIPQYETFKSDEDRSYAL